MPKSRENKLDALYRSFETIEGPRRKDSEAVEEAQQAMLELSKSRLQYEDYMRMDELIGALMAASDEQGFKTGFKYAVNLILSCEIGGAL